MPTDTMTDEEKKAKTHGGDYRQFEVNHRSFEASPEVVKRVKNAPPEKEKSLTEIWHGLSKSQRESALNNMTPEEMEHLSNEIGIGRNASSIQATPSITTPAGMKEHAYSTLVKGTSLLPAAGGIIGGWGAGVATAPFGPGISVPAKIVGSGIGGGAGEALRQTILQGLGVDDKQSSEERAQDVGKEALWQMGGELGGVALGRMLRPTLDKSLNKIVAAGGLGRVDTKNLENVINDLIKVEKAPGNKVTTIGEFAQLLNTAKRDIGNDVNMAMMRPITVNGKLVPLGQAQANTGPITARIQLLIGENPDLARGALGESPAWQRAITTRLRTYFKPRTFSELTNHRITLNNNLRAMYDLPRGEQGAYLASHPNLVIDKAEADAIRDVIYPEMDRAGGFPKDTTKILQEKRGAIMSLADTLQKRAGELHADMRDTAGKDWWERGNVSTYGTRSGPGFAFHRLDRMVHMPNPEANASSKVSRAFGNKISSKVAKGLTKPLGDRTGSKELGDEILSLPLRYLTMPATPSTEEPKGEAPPPEPQSSLQNLKNESEQRKPKTVIAANGTQAGAKPYHLVYDEEKDTLVPA